MKEFLIATGTDGIHTATHADCRGCKKAKATLRLVGVNQMKSLFDHVGGVTDADAFEVALAKAPDGIRLQNIQATARFKLLQQMPQGGKSFAEWYVKIKQNDMYGQDI